MRVILDELHGLAPADASARSHRSTRQGTDSDSRRAGSRLRESQRLHRDVPENARRIAGEVLSECGVMRGRAAGAVVPKHGLDWSG